MRARQRRPAMQRLLHACLKPPRRDPNARVTRINGLSTRSAGLGRDKLDGAVRLGSRGQDASAVTSTLFLWTSQPQ